MALRDFKQYMATIQAQYLEMKADLADFEEAVRAGNITEDKLAEVKADVANVEANYNRLLYVAYLLELPRRKSKKEKRARADGALRGYFRSTESDAEYVEAENKSIIADMRKRLAELSAKEEK